jgi:hypothetical protein
MTKVVRLWCVSLALFLCLLISEHAGAGAPNCSKPDGWASNMAFSQLKNLGLLHNETTDFARTKVTRLASEKIGTDLYRQIHQIVFTEKSGHTLAVITISDASHQECSMGDVRVFVISQQVGRLN